MKKIGVLIIACLILGLCVPCYGQGSPILPVISIFARTVLDDTTQAAMQTTLGLGTGDSPTFVGLILSGKVTMGTSPGASGIALDGTDPDYLLQSHAKITTDLATGAYSSIYNSNTITSNQTNNTSIFSDWAELYITGDLTLSSANNAAIWGNLEMADAGGSLTLSADTLWLAGIAGTVISPDGLVIETGRDVAGILSDSSITAGYTNNGTFSAFAARKSYGKEPWPVAYNVLSGAATIDFQGQGCTLSPNSAIFQPLDTDSTTFFQVKNAAGDVVGNFDVDNKRFGIGTDAPDYELDVAGNIGINGYIYHNDDTNTRIQFSDDRVIIVTGADEVLDADEGSHSTLQIDYGGVFDISFGINRMFIGGSEGIYNGYVGIGDATPETLLELTHASPKITGHNSTHEDGDDLREFEIIAKGEQTGGEETTLGKIRWSHDGAADDEKGKIEFSTNDGDDSDTPTLQLTIAADGGIHIANMKSGTDQADAGAAAGELYFDTNDDNTIKMGI